MAIFFQGIALAVKTDEYFGYPQPFKWKNTFFEWITSAIQMDEEFIRRILATVQTTGIFSEQMIQSF